MLNGKAMIVHLTVGLIKRQSINEWIFSRTEIFKIKSQIWIRFILLCNKSRFKKSNRCWYIKICWKCWFSWLKSNEEKLDIDKLKNLPTNFRKIWKVFER